MRVRRSILSTLFLAGSGAVWLLTVGSGLMILYDYSNSPSEIRSYIKYWPVQSSIPFEKGWANLVMTAHPHCACTRASLSELARIMTHGKDKIKAHVLFMKPSEFPDKWIQTDLWRNANTIPSTHAIEDKDGAEANLFHATTSGQVFLFDQNGTLIFTGGITGARGHEGDNKGESAILDWIKEGKVTARESFVFGCSLFTPNPAANAAKEIR